MEEGWSSAGAEMENKDDALKSELANSCAKAAVLIAFLKSSPNLLRSRLRIHGHDKEEEMVREILKLKLEILREKMKSKTIRMSALMDSILQVILVLFLSISLLVIALRSRDFPSHE